jgi:alanine dehydrogenase
MLVLSEHEVAGLLSMPQAIALMDEAFRAQAQGRVKLPVRTMAPTRLGVLGSMPAAIEHPAGSNARTALGAKLVTAFAKNAERGKPSHQALVMLFDPDSGEPLALMDGRYITEVRTAATSALATRALANPGASVLAIVGTGVQARAHIDALRHVMQVNELRVWGRTRAHAAALADFAPTLQLEARLADSPAAAARGAQVICTVTGAREPLLSAGDVDPGTHLNAVGFAWPNARELSSDLMRSARVFVDSVASALSEAGDVMLAIADGALPQEPDLTPLGDVVDGRAQGRRSRDEITVFESVGIALEDVACAAHVYALALERGGGTRVEI